MRKNIMMTTGAVLAATGALFLNPMTASAHCDTMDGPVIGDAQKALAEENSSYIAKWVLPEREEDIEGIFAQVMEVRDDSPEAQKLADQYLFENLVRIHREGEEHEEADLHPTAQTDDLHEVENVKAAGGHIEPETEEPKASWLPWGLAGTFFVTTIAGFLKRRV